MKSDENKKVNVAGIRIVNIPGSESDKEWEKKTLWINVTEFEKKMKAGGTRTGQIDFSKLNEPDKKGNVYAGYMHINGDKSAEISMIIDMAALENVQKYKGKNPEKEIVYASFDLNLLSVDIKEKHFGNNDFVISQHDPESGENVIVPGVQIRYTDSRSIFDDKRYQDAQKRYQEQNKSGKEEELER